MDINSLDNPMATEGFAFLEFCGPKLESLLQHFFCLGFRELPRIQEKKIFYLQHDKIDFRLNFQDDYALEFAKKHGASTCAMGFKVKDAIYAHQRALALGAENVTSMRSYPYPAIYGIGNSLLYFVDENLAQYDLKTTLLKSIHLEKCQTFSTTSNELAKETLCSNQEKDIYVNKQATVINDEQETLTSDTKNILSEIDHVTHNVNPGEMDKWAQFYEKLFNFKEIRYFDIHGQFTGLHSRAMASPCGKIRIPINEATEEQSQIQEFIKQFNGEGIQHIALTSENIYQAVKFLKQNGIQFLDTPDTYYEMLLERIPWHQEDMIQLQKLKILMDGTKLPDNGLLLQIFTENMLGPVFFEVIQRKGNQGFGEGNFQALFEAIERDQIRRGTL